MYAIRKKVAERRIEKTVLRKRYSHVDGIRNV